MAKELHELNELEERVILVAVEMDERSSRSAMDTDACLDELEELVKTAGGTAVARSVQKRERIHPGHYLGTGKIEELKAMLSAYDATGIVCDDELSPAQLRNLEQMLGTKVMDRTIVILDIFAAESLIWRREDSGGAGTAEISPFPTDGDGRIHVSSGRRHWDKGPRGKEAGNRQTLHQGANCRAE